jgi:hypothetical protein
MFAFTPRSPQPRRNFLSRLGVGALAVLAGTSRAGAEELAGAPLIVPGDDDKWLTSLHGAHRQYFDAVSTNDGFPLYYALNWAATMKSTYKLTNADVNAVIGFRHFGIGPAFTDAIWAKYKLGEFFKVNDPKTNKPSTRNFFNSEAPGDLKFAGASPTKQMQAGATVVVCNLATTIISGMAASAAGLKMKPEEAYKEWVAGVIPGSQIVPSGVLAVHRAQEAGKCSYCYAG